MTVNQTIMRNYERRRDCIIEMARRGHVEVANRELDIYRDNVICAIAEQNVEPVTLAQYVQDCNEAVAEAEAAQGSPDQSKGQLIDRTA